MGHYQYGWCTCGWFGQTTAAVGLNVNVNKDIRVGADWTYYGRNYSYYQVDGTLLSINKENTLDDPWRIPAASMIDLNASWKFKIGGLDAVFSGNVNNLLNYQYIEKAWNPKGKDCYRRECICVLYPRAYI